VAILFRGYALRTLRQAIREAIERSDRSALAKRESINLIADSNLGLEAYDRVIRAVVNPQGDISAASVGMELHKELRALRLPESVVTRLEQLLSSRGVFDSVSSMVHQNGELFGAYRAAGNGGLPQGVFIAFAGIGRTLNGLNSTQLMEELSRVQRGRFGAVAGTEHETLQQIAAQGKFVPNGATQWYVPSHAYTILNYQGTTVTLRNPWGDHPDSANGVFSLTLNDFQKFFPYVTLQN
jgi:hypothetical protein